MDAKKRELELTKKLRKLQQEIDDLTEPKKEDLENK